MLKLYNLGKNFSDSENVDKNLSFSTIDVIYVGSDRKSWDGIASYKGKTRKWKIAWRFSRLKGLS